MCTCVDIDETLLVCEMQRGQILDTFADFGLREASLLLEIRLTDEDHWSVFHDFWPALIREIRILLCTDDPKYDDLRPNIIRITNNKFGRKALAALAASIAATLDLVAATILPFIALALYAITKIGINAWCATTDEAGILKQLDSVELDKS